MYVDRDEAGNITGVFKPKQRQGQEYLPDDSIELLLKKAQTAKVAELNIACEADVVNGFVSNALGSGHTYKSSRDDQLNLIGAKAAGTDTPLYCRPDGGEWEWVNHTSAQVQQVLDDGKTIKTALLQQCRTKKAQVLSSATATVSAVEAIIWE